MKRTIRIKKHLPYNLDFVWRALTEAQWLGKWFMQNDIKPELDYEFTFRMAPQKGWDGITYCKIVELEPMKQIGYTYQGEATGEKALACAGIHSDKADKISKGIFTKLDTVLRFKIEPTCGDESILYMEHSGYKGLKLVIVSLIMGMGWKKQINKKLPKVLDEITKNG